MGRRNKISRTRDAASSQSARRRKPNIPTKGVRKDPKRKTPLTPLTAPLSKSTPKSTPNNGEKRLRRHRPSAPQSFHEVFLRATTQRFFVLNRVRHVSSSPGPDDSPIPSETVELAGTTGNIYKVHISRQPRCDCPHGRAGNQCKHWIYVMARVLRAKWEYVYQLALLGDELRDIFRNAPVMGVAGRGHDGLAAVAEEAVEAGNGKGKGKRKPVEGDCCICFMELVEDGSGGGKDEGLVWCRAACGQNMHKECFRMWEVTKGQGKTNCPYCRTQWESAPLDMRSVASAAGRKGRNEEGYVNVAGELGLSGERGKFYMPYRKSLSPPGLMQHRKGLSGWGKRY
ncbi:uncharacterized protein MKZ38_002196 [Zalerion maritima]|uniref:Uncharacterized protein n=1 Tax=Zalerion maritima TaxID=339359 RepID=A0AAD5RQZ3_9PEZI|nr:uncharacterized protein MKZ38_002196 [Zalerion maritima]